MQNKKIIMKMILHFELKYYLGKLGGEFFFIFLYPKIDINENVYILLSLILEITNNCLVFFCDI